MIVARMTDCLKIFALMRAFVTHSHSIYNCHLLTFGGEFENSWFYERVWYLATVHVHCCTSHTLKCLIYVLLYTISVSQLLTSPASVYFPAMVHKIYYYCCPCTPARVLVSWWTGADETSDSYTGRSLEQNSRARVEEDNPKRLCRDSIVPYTFYYTTTVFVPTVRLNISSAVEYIATEAAIQVYTPGIYTNWTSREN